jgi:hypothetical protein
MSIGKLASGLRLKEGEGGRDMLHVIFFENADVCMQMHENAWVCKKFFFF